MKPAAPDKAPFIKIIIPAVTGVVLSTVLCVPFWAAALSLIVVFGMAAIIPKGPISDIYLWLSVMFFFFAIAVFYRPVNDLPPGKRVIATVQVMENTSVRGRWAYTSASVGYWRNVVPAGKDERSNEWIKASGKILLMVDTTYKVSVGDQLAVRGWINPIDTTGGSYGRLMARRNIHGRMFVTAGNLLSKAPHTSITPGYYSAKMQESAIARLSKLDMDSSSMALVTAMTAGDKRGIDRMLRNNYSRSGAAHLLAVSGLHVGIVFVLINLILYFLPVIRRGHVIKNVVAVAAIWAYAFMSGLSPSVVRAALMFSFAQAALATTSYRDAVNIILGSAVLMLAVNPNYAADPSFLLSYSAVLAICIFYMPLYSLVRTRYKIVNALTSVIIVGLVASAGTAPLVSHMFGSMPVSGLLINPLVILNAHIIVMAGVLWIVLPLDFLEPVFSYILTGVARIQNSVVEWSGTLSWASAGVTLPLWAVILIYCFYTGLAVWIYNMPDPETSREKRLSLQV